MPDLPVADRRGHGAERARRVVGLSADGAAGPCSIMSTSALPEFAAGRCWISRRHGHGDPAGQRLDLREEVADPRRRRALRGRAADDRPSCSSRGPGVAVIVEDCTAPAMPRSADVDDLLRRPSAARRPAARIDRDLETSARPPLAQLGGDADARDAAMLWRSAPGRAALLTDMRDAADERVAGLASTTLAADTVDRARRRLQAAAEHADERRFPGAVLADQPMHLCRCERATGRRRGRGAWKPLGDAGEAGRPRVPAGRNARRWRRRGRASARPGSHELRAVLLGDERRVM